MANSDEVIQFLKNFKAKMEVFGIVFMDSRLKNTQTLATLELTPAQRKKIIADLKLEDYTEGPIEDKQFIGGDLWVFGKMIKQQEVYIKIAIGGSNKQTICISFHLSEYPMTLPFKTK